MGKLAERRGAKLRVWPITGYDRRVADTVDGVPFLGAISLGKALLFSVLCSQEKGAEMKRILVVSIVSVLVVISMFGLAAAQNERVVVLEAEVHLLLPCPLVQVGHCILILPMEG